MADGDSNREYEMVDPSCFVNTKHANLGRLPFLPPDVRDQKTKKIMAYENPVSMKSENEHTYESPVSTKVSEQKAQGNAEPKMRARVNDVYEGYNTDESMTNAKIFEAIRSLGSEKSSEQTKESCHIVIGGFAFFSLILLLLLSLGSSAYIFYRVEMQDSSGCSCRLYEDNNSDRAKLTDDIKENFTKTINQLEQNLKLLQAKLNSVETEQKTQFDDTKKSVNTLNEQLSSTIESINSTFKVQLKNVKSNISVLGKEVDEITTDLRRTNNFSQLLSDTVENINSSFLVKLGNISKQIGPRGYNGSQGFQGLQGIQGQQGLQGVGNLSACTVQTKSSGRHEINDGLTKATKVPVAIDERTGYKIMAAVCSTKKHAGASQTVLVVTKPQDQYKYTCICAGVSESGDFVPVPESGKRYIECLITYWECPLLS